jgi:hypothetical protein
MIAAVLHDFKCLARADKQVKRLEGSGRGRFAAFGYWVAGLRGSKG